MSRKRFHTSHSQRIGQKILKVATNRKSGSAVKCFAIFTRTNLCVILFCFFLGNIFGQNGTIAGLVQKGLILGQENEKVVPFATITVYARDTFIAQTNSDSNGKFLFENIVPREYTVVASAAGYEVSRVLNLSVTPGKTVHLTFRLFDSNVSAADKKNQIWKEFFVNHSDKNSAFKIGHKMCEGNYKGGKKEGEWVFFHPNSDTAKIEVYQNGKLIRTRK